MLNLFQCNIILNIKNCLLDFILFNYCDSIIAYLCFDSLAPPDKYHPPLRVLYFSTPYITSFLSCQLSYDCQKGDYCSILSFFGTFNRLDFLKLNTGINVFIDNFYSITFSAIESYNFKMYINHKFSYLVH